MNVSRMTTLWHLPQLPTTVMNLVMLVIRAFAHNLQVSRTHTFMGSVFQSVDYFKHVLYLYVAAKFF
jgi:hypothetical protein